MLPTENHAGHKDKLTCAKLVGFVHTELFLQAADWFVQQNKLPHVNTSVLQEEKQQAKISIQILAVH